MAKLEKIVVPLPRNFLFEMNKEQESVDVMTEELVEEEKSLLLHNDDHNTFEYVIQTLVEVCDHTYEQAETCAWITHFHIKETKTSSLNKKNVEKF